MIAGEDVVGADGNIISRAELLLRRWSRSKNPKLQLLFIEYAFGPVPPTKIETTNTLQPGVVLRLHFPHERPDLLGSSALRLLPSSDDGASRRLKGP